MSLLSNTGNSPTSGVARNGPTVTPLMGRLPGVGDVPGSVALRFTDPYEYSACIRAAEVKLTVTEAGHFAAMSLPVEDMETLMATHGGSDPASPKGPLIFIPPAAAMDRLQRLHAVAGHLAEHAPEVVAHPTAALGLEQALKRDGDRCMADPKSSRPICTGAIAFNFMSIFIATTARASAPATRQGGPGSWRN